MAQPISGLERTLKPTDLKPFDDATERLRYSRKSGHKSKRSSKRESSSKQSAEPAATKYGVDGALGGFSLKKTPNTSKPMCLTCKSKKLRVRLTLQHHGLNLPVS